MSSIVYLKNLKSNTIYAYLNEPVWDPVKNKNVYKRKCIGHLDPVTGKIVPNRASKSREYPGVRSRYVCAIFDKASESMKLTEALRLSFPDDWKKIMSVAYYLAATAGELSFCKQWSEIHKTPYNQAITSKILNELLISINSNSISLFFTLWKLRLQPVETYMTSTTFEEFSSDYSKRPGIGADSSSKQVNIDIFVSAKNNIPICYRLSDKATGHTIGDYDVYPESFSRLSSFIDMTAGNSIDPSLIPYADSNLTVLIRPENEFVNNLFEKSEKTMTNPENYRIISGIPFFTVTYMEHLNNRKYYVHIYFDPNKAVEDLSAFISIIHLCKYEVETDKTVPEHAELYDKYLISKTDESGMTTVELNSEAILHHNRYMGYTVLISNFTKNPSNAMIPFLRRRAISKTFSQIRNEYDNNSLNLFTETNYLSSVFLQFIALIIKSRIENIMNAKKLNRIMTFKEMVSEISNIMTVSTPGVKKTSDTYMNDSQIRILEAFGIDYTEK